MKASVLGFASIVCCGVTLAPLLVEPDQISAQRLERQATAPATGRWDAIGQLRADGSETKWYPVGSGCAIIADSQIADAR